MIVAAVIYALRLRYDQYDPDPSPSLTICALCLRDAMETEGAFRDRARRVCDDARSQAGWLAPYYDVEFLRADALRGSTALDMDEASPTGHALVEYECANMALDDRGVPRQGPNGTFSLVGRIEAYAASRVATAINEKPQ